jgi:DNA-binding NarL/FixJ family response regulator
MNVLIVDDHPTMLEYLTGAVTRAFEGARVWTASDLERALNAVRGQLPDLILLDLGLPGCSGIDSLLRFREAYAEARIVVVSTVDDANTIRSALAAGAAGYIPKSGNVRLLMGALRLVAEGGTYIPPQALGDVFGKAPARDRASGE